VVRPFGYLRGAMNRSEYISSRRPEYPVMEFINENLPINSKILFIYMGKRGYYCDRAYVFDMKGSRSTLHEIVKREKDPLSAVTRLKEMEISHLLIRHDIFKKWVGKSFSKEDKVVLEKFIEKHVQPVFVKGQYGVYRLI
jgi:hypothetical protein